MRAATPADEPRVRDLLDELGYPPARDTSARLAHWTGQQHRYLLLAERSQEAVGLVAVTLTPRLESDAWWAQVVALVVASKARGQGVGHRLLRHVEQLAAHAGCDAIIVNSSRERLAAQRFYTTAGYHDRCDDHAEFIRSLPSTDPGSRFTRR